MKLDLNKPWVMKLVRNHSTRNGCSFIRGVILHYLFKGAAAIVLGAIALWVVISLLAGPYMYFFGNNFFGGGNMHLDYFGDSTIAKFLSASFFIGGVAWIMIGILGTAFGLAYGFVTGLKKTVQSGVIGDALDKIIPSFSIPLPLKQAVSAWHDKFCPKIELILPERAVPYKVGARVQRKEWIDDGETYGFNGGGEITQAVVNGRTLCLTILWDDEKASIEQTLVENWSDDSPEENEERRKRYQSVYSDQQRFWLDQEDEDWDNIRIEPVVEETSSPQ
jgi:hypothetical protein